MRVERLVPGDRASPALTGSILTRDLIVGPERWRKGRPLSAFDVERLAAHPEAVPTAGLSLLVPDSDDVHEDAAALVLAQAVRGTSLTVRGPSQSRVDLIAAAPGVLHVDSSALEEINGIDPLEVFTRFDGSVVNEGDLVASIKVAPHLVPATTLERGTRIARAAEPVVAVARFVPLAVAAVATEPGDAVVRDRFESGLRTKVERLGSTVVSVRYAESDSAIERELRRAIFTARAEIIVTAGAASTDPLDPFFTAIERLGGAVVRRGVPAHPGSMLWLARVGRTAILGLPTCGAFSMATAADLVLPRLLTGEAATPRLVARLGHGGVLTRDQRFRFPAYARDLHAPEG